QGRRPAWLRLALAAGIVGLGIYFAVAATFIRVLPSYARVGPKAFPYLVGAGLILLGLALAWRAWRGLDDDRDAEAAGPADHRGIVLVVAGLVLQSLIIEQVGFVLAATLTFVLTTAGFGSRRWLVNAGIGLALSLGSYVGFTRGL